ncbi:hypothetical protein PRIPAC_79888 [Pristionchus pacificus]|uniref:Uncharacterized protein n=1 Tax=Pristionchus pacificus TaxID=54126 RepID=A0A2A6CQC2_PRIPA|nr:hypothetical protein PRIPAC_79888 [Pristionchus pacificus]|eukprot:PDM80257.1 hypothetical protein PRIPAC_32836 [Pristionchus pacificus]
MQSLIAFSSIIVAAAACIPTKHPEPGIPATTTTMKPATNQCPMYTQATAADCTKVNAMCNGDMVNITPTMITCPKNKPVVVLTTVAGMLMLHQNTPLNSPTVICKDGAWYTGDPQRPLDNKPTLPLVQPVLLACFGAPGSG